MIIKKNESFQVLITNKSFSDTYGDSFIIEIKIPEEMSLVEAQKYCKNSVKDLLDENSQISTITMKDKNDR